MSFGYRLAKMKLVEQLTLVTLQTAHHGSTSPRFASTQRNHGSLPASTDFCNKICQEQTFYHCFLACNHGQFGGVYGSGVPIAINGCFFTLTSNSPIIFSTGPITQLSVICLSVSSR